MIKVVRSVFLMVKQFARAVTEQFVQTNLNFERLIMKLFKNGLEKPSASKKKLVEKIFYPFYLIFRC